MKTKILNAHDIRKIVLKVGLNELMDNTIICLTQAFASYNARETRIPPREGFSYHHPEFGLIEWMPTLQAGEQVHMKMVAYHPNNGRQHQLPTILSTLSLFDVANGHMQCLLDGCFITALRTGAASALASKALARSASTQLGIIGCGAQAVTQLHALSRIFQLRHLYIYDDDPLAIASFARRVQGLGLSGLEIQPASPVSFVPKVDILCTATSVATGHGPVFKDTAVQDHLHINAVGSDFKGKLELPEALARRCFICPDFRAQAIKEGECQQVAAGDIGPELHQIIKAPTRYRHLPDDLTLFDSTGWAIEDMVASKMMMAYADELHIGSDIELEMVSSDHRNPYQFIFDGIDAVVSRPSVSLETDIKWE